MRLRFSLILSATPWDALKYISEAEMVDNCALIDRVAEEMLDKYESAFLELAK